MLNWLELNGALNQFRIYLPASEAQFFSRCFELANSSAMEAGVALQWQSA